jgi:hypothetical protein
MKKLSVLLPLLFFGALLCTHLSYASTIVVSPTFDRVGGDNNGDGSFDVWPFALDDPNLFIRYNAASDPPNQQYRSVLEFSLSDMPEGTYLGSATLFLKWVNLSVTAPHAVIYGYAGNGIVELSDLEASTQLAGPFTHDNILNGDMESIDVTAYVRSLLEASAPYVGFVIAGEGAAGGGSARWASMEYPDSSRHPSLTMDAVPIPGAMWLLGSGFICLVGLRSKFKS